MRRITSLRLLKNPIMFAAASPPVREIARPNKIEKIMICNIFASTIDCSGLLGTILIRVSLMEGISGAVKLVAVGMFTPAPGWINTAQVIDNATAKVVQHTYKPRV